ncbi:glycerate kinase [Ancylomarina sp. 16SWW S1-10-2]|uniref:glycerate kinase n=1 Tax=Ancylomarina sp. 16SWW S1-10-2 TaxID=2499681 RepID=UPI0012AE3B3F|nr:glycerate kinase [Ancylomarina sp. 16SWW S1-10-2]MRT92941.1 glycerate kinase [Ancylomarina sp. 16SWW S1-10-2]
MKIIIAPDKFKGSLTGMEFCETVERGLRKYSSNVEIINLPLADAGDGTIEVLNYYLDGEMISLEVHDPLHRKIKASYLYSKSKKTAYIEMAEASGIRLLKMNEANPMLTSTYGTGELIKDALERGVEHIILGIGGSATNDAGLGMARALGYRFFNQYKEELKGLGEDLIQLHSIDKSTVHPRLKEVKFEVACDVDNPLFGERGAAYIYSPQKGASSEMVLELDAGLQNFNEVVKAQYDIDLHEISGAGAAGGLGGGAMLFLKAMLSSGIDLIKKEANFNTHIKDADWIITGEGKLDKQTFSGKVIRGIIDSIDMQKLALFCAVVDLTEKEKQAINSDYIAETSVYAKNVDDSIKNAGKYLEQAVEEFAKNNL